MDRTGDCPGRRNPGICRHVKAGHTGYAEHARTAPAAPPPSLVIRCHVGTTIGYADMSERLGKQLEALGVAVRIRPLTYSEVFAPVSDWVESRLTERIHGNEPILQIAGPGEPIANDERHRLVHLTMWESGGMHADGVKNLNRARAVVAVNRWNAESFRNAGVSVPIHVIPLGVDPSLYSDDGTPFPARFTVGMAARMAHGGERKGLDEGARAFVDAFPLSRYPDVRLKLKVYPDCLQLLSIPSDPRIKIDTAVYLPSLAAWYRSLTVLLVPSKGEGWGLHTHQAMACGRPPIVVNATGTAEFFTPECGWSLPHEWKPATGTHYTGLGDWPVPTHEGMVEALREAHADWASGGTGLDSKRVASVSRAAEFTWERSGQALLAAVRSSGILPSRPAPAIVRPKPKHALFITACLRPVYTRRVLEALARCEGVDDWRVLVHLDPGCPPVRDVVRAMAGKFRALELTGNPTVLGCSLNTRKALEHGFTYADFVTQLEDDVMPGRDFLRFVEWANRTYRDDKSVFTVSAYSRDNPPESAYYEVRRNRGFHCWAWSTWRDRWEEMAEAWPNAEYDHYLNNLSQSTGRWEIRPRLARAQNIGAEGGIHVSDPEWHRIHHFNEFGVWSREKPASGDFFEGSVNDYAVATKTPA